MPRSPTESCLVAESNQLPDDDVVVDIVRDRAVEGLDQRDTGGPHDAHGPDTRGGASPDER